MMIYLCGAVCSRRGRTLGGPLEGTPAQPLRGEQSLRGNAGRNGFAPRGPMPYEGRIAPHAGAGTPFFVAAKKGGRSRYHALDEGTK